jgi:hypothetical protein
LASAGDAAAIAVAETMKWRRLSMAFPCFYWLPQDYQAGRSAAIAPSSAKTA